MSAVREWGATLWIAQDSPKEVGEAAVVATRMGLLAEVPGAQILEEKVVKSTPLWHDFDKDYDCLYILITYRTSNKDGV